MTWLRDLKLAVVKGFTRRFSLVRGLIKIGVYKDRDYLDRSADLRIKENFRKIHMIWSSGKFKLSFRSFSSQSTIIELLLSRTWLARQTFWPSMVRVQGSLHSNGNQSCERNRYRKRCLRSISLNIAHTCNFQMGNGDLKNSKISEFEVKKISLRTVLLKITRLWRNK